jgi:hypothetical protein
MGDASLIVGLSEQQLADYRSHGFIICRQLFTGREIDGLRAETDRLLSECRDLISPGNLRCRYMPHHETGELLFEVFDPVNDISGVCEQFTADSRIVSLMESIYGEPAVLFKEKLIFKPPGAMGYNLHQDIPRTYERFPQTFATVLIAIDPSTRENGFTEVFSGYHHDFLAGDPELYMLPEDSVDPKRRVFLELNPGDVAVFHGLTPHRSAPNRSDRMRRTFYVSYNALSDGGDQRARHYAEFQAKMRTRLEAQSDAEVHFR